MTERSYWAPLQRAGEWLMAVFCAEMMFVIHGGPLRGGLTEAKPFQSSLEDIKRRVTSGGDVSFPSALISMSSLVVKGVDGVEQGSLVGGVEAEKKTYEPRKPKRKEDRQRRYDGGPTYQHREEL
jgi:hypothetical protein